MNTAANETLEKLLAPIEGAESPTGRDLQYAPEMDELKSLSTEADNSELGDWVESGGSKGPDWPEVRKIATRLLQEEGKHLQVCGYLTKALVHLDGFEGLTLGLRLIDGLLTKYWDNLYPEIEDDDLDFRAAPLSWLNLNVFQSIRSVSVISASGHELSTSDFHAWQYFENRIKQSPEHKESILNDPNYENVSGFEKHRAATSATYLQQNHTNLTEALEAFEKLKDNLLERFGADDMPNIRKLQDALEEVNDLSLRILKQAGLSGASEAAAESEAGAEELEANGEVAASPAGATGARGPIASREQAFVVLDEVATYLRRTEPLSPVALLLERAVRWGNMSFVEVLEEFVPQPDIRQQILESLGVRPGSEQGT